MNIPECREIAAVLTEVIGEAEAWLANIPPQLQDRGDWDKSRALVAKWRAVLERYERAEAL